ncbi:MAG: type II toxin-antitoxin system HicB family antitoxin [Bacteroidales bacterium]|nr:type II toxin-antitoxin system HicB family antitoxin [Bacteroidales bacterium]
MKKVRALIERGKDGTYGVYFPDDNGLEYGIFGEGDTVKEAIEDLELSYRDMKKIYEEEGRKFTEIEMQFGYDVPSFLAYYSGKLSLAGLSRITGVAQGQLSHYITGHRRPSKATVEKISRGLHAFAEDLAQVQLV